ncbi:MAG TPA: VCBS repeat-containing protein [Thermoanaerobaculia bacterium]|nr:VCBS repeat-containing protein [Thermoanaerobaculia bacterium]
MFPSRAVTLLALVLLASATSAATRTWTGASGTLWTDAGNWQGGVAPAPGDALVFPRTAPNLTNTNDYPVDTIFHSLSLGPDNQSTAATINISGNRLRVTNGVILGHYFQFFVSLPQVDPVGTQAWGGDGSLTIAGSPNLTMTTSIPAATTVNINHVFGSITLGGAGSLATGNRTLLTLYMTGFTGTVSTTNQQLPLGVFVDNSNAPVATLLSTGAPCEMQCQHGLTIRNSVLGTVQSTGGKVHLNDATQSSTVSVLDMNGAAQLVAFASTGSPTPLTVLDTLSLGGASLHFTAMEPIPMATTKVLIDNQTANPVSGTFAGLPEGSRIIASGTNQHFAISYEGGDGNDITLTAVSTARSDFDGDGRSDIFWRHTTGGQNYLWTMNGFTPQTMGFVNDVPDLDWKIEALADFNGNGKSDVLWRHALTGDLYMYLMDGRTIVGAGAVGQVTDLDWRIAGTGDFDNDGKADILWRHELTGENYLYLMNGINIRSGGSLFTVEDTDWKVVAIADLNQDRMAEIIWRHSQTGEVFFWQMNGHERLAFGTITTIPDQDWKLAAVADFDNDAYNDLLWRHAVTGENQLYRLQNVRITQQFALDAVHPDWDVAGAGDYNGDAKADILWRNRVTGENYLYLMDGGTVAAPGALPQIPDTEWTIER